MAAVAGLSPFHFSREFRRRTGSSPYAFVMVERIERSKTLLRNGLSVTAVAVACGFTDHAHYARVFKRATRMSPSEYALIARR
jgi:AraC family transcriptional regulator